MTYAAIKNRQRKQSLVPITFKAVDWKPQVKVTFTRDVNGWLSMDKRIKWHFAAGSTHMIDEDHAVEFIVKGYATGELPRHVSEDEKAELRSTMTTIGIGQDQTRA